MSDLLKEALADAKAVRATALANAKVALEEAFGERVQAMFAERLKNEVAADESVSSGIGDEHGNVPAKQHPKKPAHQPTTQKGSQVFDTHLEEKTEDPGAGDHMGDNIEEEDSISDAELEEIIAELEKDASMDEEEGAAPTDPIAPAPAPVAADPNAVPPAPVSDTPMAPAPVSDTPMAPAPAPAPAPVAANPNAVPPAPAPETPVSEEDMEEISLDELLAELEKEEDGEEAIKEEAGEDEEDSKDESAYEEQIAEVTAQRDEAYKTVEILRSQINEVNLLNAKLLYTNKLFKQFSLNNEQKMKVVENFDLTTSVREVKLTYAIMAESFNLGGSVVKKKNTTATTITEGLASRPVASTKPSQPIVAGGNQMAERFKTLAGIKK